MMCKSAHLKSKSWYQTRMCAPDLFSLYSEMIRRNLEGYPGIRKHKVNSLRFTHDTVLIAENKKKTCNGNYTLLKKKAERKDWN